MCRYDIYVRMESTELAPGLLRMPAPEFTCPVAPLDLQCRVSLENGWTPLHREVLSSIGVPAASADQSDALRFPVRLWNLAQAWFPFGAQVDRHDQLSTQRSLVLLAEKQMRDSGDGKAIQLGEALEQLALKHLKDTPLVLDRVALSSLGLTAETMISASALSPQARPFWESLGLIYEPSPSGALLTTTRRLHRLGIGNLDAAIREAILHGRDASGGFVLVSAWLRLPSGDVSFFAGIPFTSAEHGGEFPEMTEWEVLPDGWPADGFYVFDPQFAHILSACSRC